MLGKDPIRAFTADATLKRSWNYAETDPYGK